MTKRRYLPAAPIAFATAFLLIMCLAGCAEKEKPASAPPPSEHVWVVFEGPWGYAPDPNDPNSIIAIAPATPDHHDLYVQASYSQQMKPGHYELAMPPRTVAPPGTIISDIFQTPIDPKVVNNVFNNVLSDPSLHRYAVRLPKPESYTPYTRYPSSIGSAPHPAANGIAARPWATGVALQYTVGSLSTFKVTGTPDTGIFPDFTLQLDAHQISFVITPLHDDDPTDLCYIHDRVAFHNLTTLLGVTLFVDFQGSPPTCPAVDVEKPSRPKAQTTPAQFEPTEIAAYRAVPVQEAGVVPASSLSALARSPLRSIGRGVIAAFYFFAHPTGDCKAANIIASQGGS